MIFCWYQPRTSRKPWFALLCRRRRRTCLESWTSSRRRRKWSLNTSGKRYCVYNQGKTYSEQFKGKIYCEYNKGKRYSKLLKGKRYRYSKHIEDKRYSNLIFHTLLIFYHFNCLMLMKFLLYWYILLNTLSSSNMDFTSFPLSTDRCQFLPVITESSDQTPHGSPSPSGSRPSTASHSGINRPVSGTSRQEEGLTDPNSRPTSGSPRPAPQMSGSGSRPQSATMSPGLRQPPRSSPTGSRPSSGRSAHSSVSAGGHNREGSSYLNAGFQEDTPPSHGK